jgi:hypothetical protein
MIILPQSVEKRLADERREKNRDKRHRVYVVVEEITCADSEGAKNVINCLKAVGIKDRNIIEIREDDRVMIEREQKCIGEFT